VTGVDRAEGLRRRGLQVHGLLARDELVVEQPGDRRSHHHHNGDDQENEPDLCGPEAHDSLSLEKLRSDEQHGKALSHSP
jgi:hypothetical protein